MLRRPITQVLAVMKCEKKGYCPRSKSTEKRVKMYRSRIHHTKDGKLIGGEFYSSTADSDGRIAPNRKYFGNSRVLGQKQLETFRQTVQSEQENPQVFLVNRKSLPTALLKETQYEGKKSHILDVEGYETIISGGKIKRKKPNLAHGSLEELMAEADDHASKYDPEKDEARLDVNRADHSDKLRRAVVPHLERAQTARVYSEMYKVIDSSDVVVQVLDARDPLGTRSKVLESYMKKDDHLHRHLIFVLNKADLIPVWATARWIRILSKEYPTIAFHASETNPFGKGALIALLRQFSRFHRDRKHVSVGFVGYPNVGKSSVINCLKNKKVCKVAPIPGETKIWQYITLTKRLYLIDCPGVVYPDKGTTPTDLILRGVLRVENLQAPDEFIDAMIARSRPAYINRTYGLRPDSNPLHKWKDGTELVEVIGRKYGKLMKGNEVDAFTVSVMLLREFLRGRIPWFIPPPEETEEEKQLSLERRRQALLRKIGMSDADVGETGSSSATAGEGKKKSGQDGEEEGDEGEEEEELDDETKMLLGKGKDKKFMFVTPSQKFGGIRVKNSFSEDRASEIEIDEE
ncbi:Nucleolar GTP-binding protein 2, partial [Aduncisulcus paluster]